MFCRSTSIATGSTDTLLVIFQVGQKHQLPLLAQSRHANLNAPKEHHIWQEGLTSDRPSCQSSFNFFIKHYAEN